MNPHLGKWQYNAGSYMAEKPSGCAAAVIWEGALKDFFETLGVVVVCSL